MMHRFWCIILGHGDAISPFLLRPIQRGVGSSNQCRCVTVLVQLPGAGNEVDSRSMLLRTFAAAN
jgi:hypothetical protein